VRIFSSCFSKNHCNIIPSPTFRCYKNYLPFRISEQNCIHTSPSYLAHLILNHNFHSNYIWRGVQTLTLFTTLFSSTPYCPRPLRTAKPCSWIPYCLNTRDQVLHIQNYILRSEMDKTKHCCGYNRWTQVVSFTSWLHYTRRLEILWWTIET